MIKLKSESDIGKIRASCDILSETYREIVKMVDVGVSLLEIDGFTREFIRKRGGKPAFLGYQGFPASICISVNSVVIHGIPDKRKLESGDVVSLDLGVDLDGYISDAACTIPIGSISKEAETLLRVTKECLELGIEQAKAGNRIRDISSAVYDHADGHGFGVVRQFCGHGVGFSLHEDPQIPNYVGPGPNPRLKDGMVLAIEPMINLGGDEVEILDDGWTVETIDRSLSAHFEHTVAVFKDHTEILTSLP